MKILKALEWAYDMALAPDVPGVYSAFDLVEDHKRHKFKSDEGLSSLMRWFNAKAATALYLSRVCGLVQMPAGISSSIACVLFVHIRVVTAIAILGRFDVHNEKVRALIFSCMCGAAAKKILKMAGIRPGHGASMDWVDTISPQALRKIRQNVGIRLVTRLGEAGLIHLDKKVPFVRETVSDTFDAVAAISVGQTAREIFVGRATPSRFYSKAS